MRGGGRHGLQVEHSATQPQPSHQPQAVAHTLHVLELHKPVAVVLTSLTVEWDPDLRQWTGLQGDESGQCSISVSGPQTIPLIMQHTNPDSGLWTRLIVVLYLHSLIVQ